MPKSVSSSEAQNNFGAVIRLAETERDGVVVERHGKPKAVIISYELYTELTALRERNRKYLALAELRALREEVQQYTEYNPSHAYREAGLSPDVIDETLQADEDNANAS